MFEDPPIFNSAERKRFFTFPNAIHQKAATLRKPSTQIGFLLSCGYFKASKKFFKPEYFHHNDIAYVAHKLGMEAIQFTSDDYEPRTRQRHEQTILNFYGYKRFDNDALISIENEVASMMRSQLKPKLIFWRCIDLLIRERVQTPAYFQLSELILTAVNQRKKELSNVIRQQLQPETKSLLDGLFAQKTDNPYARYKLTLLKKLSQSAKPTQIKERCSDLQYLAELHEDLQPLLPILDLGYEGIQYFANSVIKSDIFQLNQRREEDRYIHVVAFITHQYYRLQDNLVDTLLSAVKSFENGAKRDYKDWCFEQRKTQNQSLKTLASSIDTKVFGFVHQIRDIIGNDDSDADKLALIKDLLEANQPDFLDAEREWSDFKSGLSTGAHDPHYFDILEERSL